MQSQEYFVEANVGMHHDVVAVDKGFTSFSIAKENWRQPAVLDTNERREVWQSKELHGCFFRGSYGADVDLSASAATTRNLL